MSNVTERSGSVIDAKVPAAGTSDERNVDAEIQEILNLPMPGGKTTVATFNDLISGTDVVLDLATLEIPRQINVVIPGMVSGKHKVEGAKALWELGKSKGISESDKHQIQFMMQVFQSFIAHSTSPNVGTATNREIVAKYDGKEVAVTQEEIRTRLDNSLKKYGYENTSRQFGRTFSTTIIQGLVSNKLVPNVKLCAKHGVPPNYYPYSPDCLTVDSRLHGMDAMIANEMARMIALRNSGNSGKVTHNLFENTAMAPDVFLSSSGRK